MPMRIQGHVWHAHITFLNFCTANESAYTFVQSHFYFAYFLQSVCFVQEIFNAKNFKKVHWSLANVKCCSSVAINVIHSFIKILFGREQIYVSYLWSQSIDFNHQKHLYKIKNDTYNKWSDCNIIQLQMNEKQRKKTHSSNDMIRYANQTHRKPC